MCCAHTVDIMQPIGISCFMYKRLFKEIKLTKSKKFGSLKAQQAINFIMDDYMSLNMSAYAGDKQQHHSIETNFNKENHVVLMIPGKAHTQTHIINQIECSSDTSENRQAQNNNIGDPRKMTKMTLFFMAVLLAAILLISLGAIVLSIISFIASGNISIKYDATNNDITSLATTIENNVSQLGIQLDALNSLAIIEQAQTIRLHCGDGVWYRIAHLNMSDPSQQCPSAWRKYYGTGNIRICGRANNTAGSCSSVSLSMISTGRLYSGVCGRVIGYQLGSPDAFRKHAGNDSINFDGVNITYGTQRHHIWSYVASWSENSQSFSCPCSTATQSILPQFIGKRYYCESGNPTDNHMNDHLYTSDPLWDGQQCEGTCCTGTNSPPWFKVQLPAPTTEAIEVSICADQSTNDEDTPIALLEIYVQ